MSPQEYKTKYKDELEKPVTMGILLEFTDSFLIPRMSDVMKDMIRDEIVGAEHRLKDYIDRKLSDHTADMFQRLDERYHKEKQFKQKVVELFRKHNIGSSDEVAFLEGLAQ